jgi:hypothetical protein
VNIIIFLKDKKKTRKKKGIKKEAKASIIFNKKMNDILFIEKNIENQATIMLQSKTLKVPCTSTTEATIDVKFFLT